jgi:4-amino-4-deoxy-L-arabinose transferase-like glycosyltransferase
MKFPPLAGDERRWLAVLLVAVVAIRLASLGAYPLLDPTESRYADLARRMLATGDWLVPRVDHGIPFWAKPPLSTWSAAAAMAVFGVNEFAARLPSFLLLCASGLLVARMARGRSGSDAALWSVTIFATTGLVFVSAGAVMTDPALLLGTTLAMAGFWLAQEDPGTHRGWGYAFFAGLAIGLLAKGPIAVVLTLLPAGAWTLWTGRWRAVLARLPWITGTLGVVALVVPWYALAERAAPGFLDYFLVGEHWRRFVVHGWKGDLYGAAHAWPRGMIIVMWLYAILPWSGAPAAWIFWSRGNRRARAARLVRDPWCRYLLLWAVAPLVFFTMSRNVLVTYVLPGMPAFALLLAEFWRPRTEDPRRMRPVTWLLLAGGIGLLLAFAAVLATQDRFLSPMSSRALLQRYEAVRSGPAERLIYAGQRPASAEFYSGGTAIKIADPEALAEILASPGKHYFAVPVADVKFGVPLMPEGWEALGTFGSYILYRQTPQ